MAEVLSPPASSQSPVPSNSESPEDGQSVPRSIPHPQPQARPQPRERVPSYAQNRMSQYSRSSQRSRPQSTSLEYPAFNSSLPYALVRDFAYPVFHPLHYGAQLEPSGASTPASDWNPNRRQSDPMDQWNGASSHIGGWTAGPWGGDGVMYEDPDSHEGSIAALPSTSFGRSSDDIPPLEFGEDEFVFKKGKHRKSKSYASITDWDRDRGRRRESGRRSRESSDQGLFYFSGHQTDPAGRDSLRLSRGPSGAGNEPNGARRDSRYAEKLPNRSFHHSQSNNNEDFDPDEHIPLDTEPRGSHSPVRNSMGPEDEELFAGLSLALYSFEPENSNELRLVEGQEIMVSYRHGQGWLVASDPNTGEQGLVPEAYVRLIADMPNYDPETGQFVDIDDLEEDDEDHDEDDDDGMETSEHTSPDDLHGGDTAGSATHPNEKIQGDASPAAETSSESDTPVEMAARSPDAS